MSDSSENEEVENPETQEIEEKPHPKSKSSIKESKSKSVKSVGETPTTPDKSGGFEELRSVPKVKRERTEKQKEHFARLSELNKKRYEEKRLIKEEEEAKRKRELEKKIIDKAIKIKKKIIKKEMLLEELSDDETPIQKHRGNPYNPDKTGSSSAPPKQRPAPISIDPPKYVSKFNYVR